MNKKYRHILWVCALGVLLVGTLWYCLPYPSNQPLLVGTQEAITKFKPIIPDKTQIVARGQIELAMEENNKLGEQSGELYNDKYQALLDKGRYWYVLSNAECMELLLSVGHQELLMKNWESMRLRTLEISIDASTGNICFQGT